MVCTLTGFPGVSFHSDDGLTIGEPADREGTTGGPVRLAPLQRAQAILDLLNPNSDGSDCESPAQVQIYPPGSKESVTVPATSVSICGGKFSVLSVEGIGAR